VVEVATLTTSRPYWKWLLPAAAVVLTGCSEELGPERFETARVSGIVLEGKRPIGGGWIEFMPLDGTVGKLRSAPIRPDGTFEADGIAVGANSVGIVGAELKMPEGRRLFDTLKTSIRRTIPKGGTAELKIDLLDEFALSHPAHRATGDG
jgi:hypothetical protein